MMIATILLIINFIFLLVKDKVLFSFWNFLWIYPAELFVYLLIILIAALLTSFFE